MKTKRHTCLHSPALPWRNRESVAEMFAARVLGSKTHEQPTAGTARSAAQSALPSETAHWEPKFPLDLVIAYEDDSTRSRALALYEDLARVLQNDHDLQHSWWKFHVLFDRRLLERAIDAALNADMIIVAVRAGDRLPRIARTWIDGWLGSKDGHHRALVALVDGAAATRREGCPVLSCLNKIAHQAHMDFFSHVFPAAPLNIGDPVTNISAHSTAMTPLSEKILHRVGKEQLWAVNG